MNSFTQKTIRDFSKTRDSNYFFLPFLLLLAGAIQAQQLSLDLDYLWKDVRDPGGLQTIRSTNKGIPRNTSTPKWL